MEFIEKLTNLVNENLTTEEQAKMAKGFADYVLEVNPFDRTEYEVLIKEVLELGSFPCDMDAATKEAIQNCLIEVLKINGVNPFEEVVEDSYKTKRAKQKLARLERELSEQHKKLVDHYNQANGQPMNDKRGARTFFNKVDQLEDRKSEIVKQIEAQEERVERLEWADENKRNGRNKQGGLLLTIDNIPRIEREIEKAERGESHYAPTTIRKYRKELARLKAEKEQLGNASSKAQEIINSDKVTQWKRYPTVYFIKGLRKVAIELKNGAFEVSSKYAPQTDEEKAIVDEILN